MLIQPDPCEICAAQLLTPAFVDALTDAEVLALTYAFDDVWMRPDQRISDYDWRYYTHIAGRGWGKTFAIADAINWRVYAGEAKVLGFMAPNDDRVRDVQHKTLIETAPPWFRPEPKGGNLVWPNGVTAISYTPEAPGRPRGDNTDTIWLTEIVDWQHTTRREAFDNMTTACRIGRAQAFIDTTSKGKNDVIQTLLELNALDPFTYPIRRGSMFDNPLLSRKYIQAECAKYSGRRFEEEIEGKTFTESEGAIFKQQWLDDHRVPARPSSPDVTIIACDPALSAHRDADECGLVRLSRSAGSVYVEEDFSGRMTPEQWGDIVVSECVDRGAAGATVERNHLGDAPAYIIKSRATARGFTTRVLGKNDPMPRRTPGVIYIKEYVAASSKGSRAGGPAAETQAGRVHMVGYHPQLEYELTTYEPGSGRSPNRFDAFAYGVITLAGLDDQAVRTTPEQVAGSAEIAKKLRAELRRRSSSRRI